MKDNGIKTVFCQVLGLSTGLLLMGLLRLSSTHQTILTPLSGLATPGYVLITVFFTVKLVRSGLPLNKFGFGKRPDLQLILLAVSAIALLRVFAALINPLIENLFGGAPNLERFADVEGSIASLVALLLTSWTLAAFGEEFAYRIVLMRGISFLLGDTRKGQILAVAIQAVMFGLIHAYQGPAGIVGSIFSGLIFGAVTIIGGWSIWPAALAHGINNTIGIFQLYYGQ